MEKFFKVFLVFWLFVGSFAYADDYLVTVNSAYEVDYMFTILNAISMIFYDESYLKLLKLLVLFGSAVALYQWVFSPNVEGGKAFTKYHIFVTLFLVAVFSMSSTIFVKTENYQMYYEDNTTSPVIGTAVKVPSVVAFSYSFLSSFGQEMTTLFTTAVSDVGGGSYSISRGGYASSIKDAINILNHNPSSGSPIYANDVEAFFAECIFIPFSSKEDDGVNHISAIFETNNIKNLISGWYASGETVGGISAGTFSLERNGAMYSCSNLWDKIVNADMTAYTANFGKIFKNADDRDLGLITKSYNLPKSNFDEIAIQSGLIYSIANNKSLPIGINYAQGKARAEFNQNNFANGHYMASMLPKLQGFLRAFIYALFPLVFALAFLPNNIGIVKNYLKMAVWIEMWGVSSAILNFFLVKYGEGFISGDVTVNSSAFMLSESANLAGIAGYLYLSVPAISYGILSGSLTALAGVSGGLTKNANYESGALATDAQKLASKETMNEETGGNFSFAEALHYKNMQAGQKEGMQTATNFSNNYKDLLKYDAQNPYNSMNAKMGTAGSFDEMMQQEGKKTGLDFASLMGSNSINSKETAFKSSAADIRSKVASARMEDKFGAGLTENAFTRDNESLIKNMTRQNEIGNQAQRDNFAKMQATQDYITQERPNAYRNDRNGDGVVSRQEMMFEAGLNAQQAKIGIADKFANQEALATSAEANKNSSNDSVRNAQNGFSSMFGDVAGASATGRKFSQFSDNNNMRKDVSQLETQLHNGLSSETVGAFGGISKVGDIKHQQSESETMGNIVPQLLQNESEIADKFRSKYGEKADMAMFSAYGTRGIFKSNLTQSLINKEITGIQNGASTQLQSGLNSYLQAHTNGSPLESGLMKTYSALHSNYEKAMKAGDTTAMKAIETSMNSSTMQPLKALANDYLNSSEAHNIASNASSAVNGVYAKYEGMGVIKRDGGSVSYLDTQKAIESASGADKVALTTRLKSGLDGLSVSTNSIDGRETKVTQNLAGENITSISRATHEFSNSGNYNNDILYHAGNHIEGETLATGVSTASTLLKVGGLTKFLVK